MKYFVTNASMVQTSLTSGLTRLSLGQIVMGSSSDVHGRRKLLLKSMILSFLFSIGCAFAPNIELFITVQFLQGFVASAGLVISRAIINYIYNGNELTKFFALLTTITSVTPLLSPHAGSVFISYTSWAGVFIFTGIIGIYLTIATKWKMKETLPIEQRIPSNYRNLLNNYKKLVLNRTFMGFALLSGILYAGVVAYISGSPFIYQKIYGVSPQVFSVLFALNGISLMLGSQLVKQLAGRGHSRSILVMGCGMPLLLALQSCLLYFLMDHYLHSLFHSSYLIHRIIAPITFTLAIEFQGHNAGNASALLGIMPFLLSSAASPLVDMAGEILLYH